MKKLQRLPSSAEVYIRDNGELLEVAYIDILDLEQEASATIVIGDFIQSVVKQTAFLQLIKDCLSDWHMYVWFNDAKHEVTRIEEDKYKDGMYFVWFDNEDEEYWMNEALTVVQMMVK